MTGASEERALDVPEGLAGERVDVGLARMFGVSRTRAADLIARVESARADLGRSRALMLYRMRRLLTTDQHVKLKVLFDEHERNKRSHSRRPQQK